MAQTARPAPAGLLTRVVGGTAAGCEYASGLRRLRAL